MPKTYSNAQKENWLKQLAQGGSPREIARKAGCDARTIQRAAQEIQSGSAAREALTQLYREALIKHMEALNAALELILDDLQLPHPYLTEIAWNVIKPSQDSSQSDQQQIVSEDKLTGAGNDPFSDRILLAEHLRHRKVWRTLTDWQRLFRKHRLACGRLQLKTLRVLSKKTGIAAYSEREITLIISQQASQEGVKIKPPILHAEVTGEPLCRTVVQYLLTKEDSLKPEEIIADEDQGVVLYHGAVLVEGLKGNSSASTCRKNILTSIETLKKSPEAGEVVALFQQLEQTLPKTRNEFQAISKLGVIPGQCRVCRELGL